MIWSPSIKMVYVRDHKSKIEIRLQNNNKELPMVKQRFWNLAKLWQHKPPYINENMNIYLEAQLIFKNLSEKKMVSV